MSQQDDELLVITSWQRAFIIGPCRFITLILSLDSWVSGLSPLRDRYHIRRRSQSYLVVSCHNFHSLMNFTKLGDRILAGLSGYFCSSDISH